MGNDTVYSRDESGVVSKEVCWDLRSTWPIC